MATRYACSVGPRVDTTHAAHLALRAYLRNLALDDLLVARISAALEASAACARSTLAALRGAG